MKTPALFLLIFCTLLLISCNNGYEFWDISKFKMDENALEDYEKVKILYTSRGPDNNSDLDYYVHLIAVSQKSGDTINILSAFENYLTDGDKDSVFIFLSQNHVGNKIIQSDKIMDITKITDIEKIPLKKINKVARDPRFDYIANNNYPTVIGTVGMEVKNNK